MCAVLSKVSSTTYALLPGGPGCRASQFSHLTQLSHSQREESSMFAGVLGPAHAACRSASQPLHASIGESDLPWWHTSQLRQKLHCHAPGTGRGHSSLRKGLEKGRASTLVGF